MQCQSSRPSVRSGTLAPLWVVQVDILLNFFAFFSGNVDLVTARFERLGSCMIVSTAILSLIKYRAPRYWLTLMRSLTGLSASTTFSRPRQCHTHLTRPDVARMDTKRIPEKGTLRNPLPKQPSHGDLRCLAGFPETRGPRIRDA